MEGGWSQPGGRPSTAEKLTSKETRMVPLALPRKSAKRDLKELPCSGQGGAGWGRGKPKASASRRWSACCAPYLAQQ